MRNNAMKIIEAERITDEVFRAFQSLIPQLTTSGEIPDREDLDAIVEANTTSLLLAVDDTQEARRIVGALTLIIYRIPTGYLARIEDVVVEQDMRKQGIGKLLMEDAMLRARDAGVKAVDLTSNPQRIAANELYLKMGFKLRNTNLYRYTFSLRDG
jgi:GNAT superfamily N-acetyltransferase